MEMKLITFSREGITKRLGAVVDDQVIDLHVAYRSLLTFEGKIRAQQIADAYIPADMTGFLQGGNKSRELAKQAIEYALENKTDNGYRLVYDLNEVKVEAPVPTPGKMICVGHNYREH